MKQTYLWLAAVYAVMSVVTFVVYAWDKRTLHLLELLCGWPGAMVAQNLIRHKSRKVSFRVVFWLMVALNVPAVWFLFFKR